MRVQNLIILPVHVYQVGVLAKVCGYVQDPPVATPSSPGMHQHLVSAFVVLRWLRWPSVAYFFRLRLLLQAAFLRLYGQLACFSSNIFFVHFSCYAAPGRYSTLFG